MQHSLDRDSARRVRLADCIAARLEQAGVRHVFGVGGANIEDLFAAVQRRQPALRVVLTKHEHGAGTAADAYARIGGGIGVVLATSGGGAMNLVHSLAEARASAVPLLALVGEPPLELQGRGAFQDTSGRGGSVDAEAVFRTVSIWCERGERAEAVLGQLERALAAALDRRGPAVLLLEKNLQQAEVEGDAAPVAAVAGGGVGSVGSVGAVGVGSGSVGAVGVGVGSVGAVGVGSRAASSGVGSVGAVGAVSSVSSVGAGVGSVGAVGVGSRAASSGVGAVGFVSAVERRGSGGATHARGQSGATPAIGALADAAQRLAVGPLLVIAGEQVAREGATDALARLVVQLGASVAVTPDARDAFDNASPRFLGVAGAMGHPPVAAALASAAVCLLVGTRLPLLARQGLEPLLARSVVISVGRGRPFVEPVLHLEGAVGELCEALVHEAQAGAPFSGVPSARVPSLEAPTAAESPVTGTQRRPGAGASGAGASGTPPGAGAPGTLLQPRAGGPPATVWAGRAVGSAAASEEGPIDMQSALMHIGRALPPGAVVLADAGNTGASVAHYLALPLGGRWLIAMGMAGMGYSFGAAIGAACASGRRCVVCAGDGAFFMHGLELHTAVEHALPITFIIFNNRAHGMCLMRERWLLGEEHGYNTFKPTHLGAGLGALFPGLASHDCRSLAELDGALQAARDASGPVLIALELPDVELPPFAALRAAAERRALAHSKESR